MDDDVLLGHEANELRADLDAARADNALLREALGQLIDGLPRSMMAPTAACWARMVDAEFHARSALAATAPTPGAETTAQERCMVAIEYAEASEAMWASTGLWDDGQKEEALRVHARLSASREAWRALAQRVGGDDGEGAE